MTLSASSIMQGCDRPYAWDMIGVLASAMKLSDRGQTFSLALSVLRFLYAFSLFSKMVVLTSLMDTQYVPSAGPFLPIKDLVPHLPKLAYQLFFDGSVEDAAAELDSDVKRTMRATLRTVDSPPPKSFLTSNKTFLGAWEGAEIPPVPFFSSVEEEYYVEEMRHQGFKHSKSIVCVKLPS